LEKKFRTSILEYIRYRTYISIHTDTSLGVLSFQVGNIQGGPHHQTSIVYDLLLTKISTCKSEEKRCVYYLLKTMHSSSNGIEYGLPK
jgi:hypothetical protein